MNDDSKNPNPFEPPSPTPLPKRKISTRSILVFCVVLLLGVGLIATIELRRQQRMAAMREAALRAAEMHQRRLEELAKAEEVRLLGSS